ncbi:hypothetical protein PIB30_012464 [Stylosanthes scabra]|uniref:F-box protein n=1 Tax=Stylosanthes scabra TaxID=79078 RepID=A0ABU6T5Z7_9FABA|nr:hypothetical protein [Stylosanthes scabra]
MASLMVSSKICRFSHGRTRATINNNVSKNKVHVTQIISRGLVAELELCLNSSISYNYSSNNSTTISSTTNNSSDMMDVAKLHLIMEAVADRIELHKNVAEQRNNWNHLLLSSVNMVTLSASAMAALAAASAASSMAPLKVSSTILYMAATGLLTLMNCIQPSQLAEEQRNAARLFKKLHGELSTMLAIGNPTASDVEDAMEKVMALDKAFPLPLLEAMLEKFPQSVEPAVWWPQRKKKTHARRNKNNNNNNGWDGRLEEEMREVRRVVKKKDMADYLRLGKRVLRLNKLLAVSGPVLTGLAALALACSSLNNNNGALMVGVICGALACALNTLEHGGQVGMVFELYRGTAGFFKLMEETIEVNLNERDPLMRENGELFEIKVALQLGRTLSELRQFTDCCECDDEFASKIF